MSHRLIGTALLMLAAITPAAAQTYSIIDLGPCTPEAINRNGQVTGHKRFSPTHANEHAFRWSPASPNTFVDLGLPKGYTFGTGLALNSWGDVAGYANNGSKPPYIEDHALLWQAGGTAQIIGPTKSTIRTIATGINDSRDVVGLQYGSDGFAFLSKVVNGKRTLYTIPRGTPQAINASGQILVSTFGIPTEGGFLWTPSGAAGSGTAVNLPAGYVGYAMTDAGALAGARHYPTVGNGGPFDSYLPVAFVSGAWMDIPWPAAIPDGEWNYGSASSINSSGVVVGTAEIVDPVISGKYASWVWDSVNRTRVLDTLIPSGTGWTLFNLNGGPIRINDNGWIMGTGTLNGEKRGFILIPNP
jgi:hypothetical protein